MEQNQTMWQANVQFGKPSGGMTPGRLIAGLSIIGLGIAFLLDRFGVINVGSTIGTWWPTILMIVAIVQIVTRSSNSWFGSAVLFCVGAVLLADNLDLLPGSFWSIFWPILVILIGIAVLTGAKKKSRQWGNGTNPSTDDVKIGSAEDTTISDDFIRRTAVLSGLDIASSSSALQGGSLTAVLAGIELDLRNAVPASDEMLLDVTAVLGGVEIRVPTSWRVHTSGSPILGEIDNRTMGNLANGATDAPLLIIRSTAILGGIEIKH
jgi:predicted membrane protein